MDYHEADCNFAIPHILEVMAQLCKSCKHDCAVNSILSFKCVQTIMFCIFEVYGPHLLIV